MKKDSVPDGRGESKAKSPYPTCIPAATWARWPATTSTEPLCRYGATRSRLNCAKVYKVGLMKMERQRAGRLVLSGGDARAH